LPTSSSLIDDRLLVAHVTRASIGRSRGPLATTTYWYYRACRAAAIGAGGQLSDPFSHLPPDLQSQATAAMLHLPAEIALPDPRQLVPIMVEVHHELPRLNVLNLEAVAAARQLEARVLLSPAAAEGVLPEALDHFEIRWEVRDPVA
jgi:hypothetical protein